MEVRQLAPGGDVDQALDDLRFEPLPGEVDVQTAEPIRGMVLDLGSAGQPVGQALRQRHERVSESRRTAGGDRDLIAVDRQSVALVLDSIIEHCRDLADSRVDQPRRFRPTLQLDDGLPRRPGGIGAIDQSRLT